MILADTSDARRKALEKLLSFQRRDFTGIFEAMKGLPVTIRLVDPPLHEFLPHGEKEIAEVAAAMGADPEKLAARASELSEFNPMLGFRGCRLGLVYPEISEMQARAVFEAAAEVQTAVDLLTTNETYFFREPKHFDALRVQASAARQEASEMSRIRFLPSTRARSSTRLARYWASA